MGIKHPSHEHRLARCKKEGEVSCGVCKQLIHGSAYGCAGEDCWYFLHFSCTELQHPLFPHPVFPIEASLECYFCEQVKDPRFDCPYSYFGLCEDCVSPEPYLVFEHELDNYILMSETVWPPGDGCLTCGKVASIGMIFRSDRGFFHAHCVPFRLPESVEHPNHPQHPLTFAEKYFDPHIVGCYCDICENERDPEFPVYHCSECEFSAHTACALSEALPSLVAEWKPSRGRADPESSNGHDLKGKLDDLYRTRQMYKKVLGTWTEKLKKVEEDYARYLDICRGGVEHHE